MDSPAPSAPAQVAEYAARVVEYVRRAVGVTLEYDSATLPVLDHYLRNIPSEQAATVELVAQTAGAYFGEVVRRSLGGRWEGQDAFAVEWRLVLPTGVNFSPVAFVTAAIGHGTPDAEGVEDAELDAPAKMRPYLQEALARMGDVSEDEYYSLCGRLDTVEHIHEVLVAVAAQLAGAQVPAPDDGESPSSSDSSGDLDGDNDGN